MSGARTCDALREDHDVSRRCADRDYHRVALEIALEDHVVRAGKVRLVRARNARERPMFDGGHIAQADRGLGAEAVETLAGVVVVVVKVALLRESAKVQPAAWRARPVLLYIIRGGQHHRAAGESLVDLSQDRVAHDAVEARGAADGVVDAEGRRAALAAWLLPDLVVRIVLRHGEGRMRDPQPRILGMLDGDRLELVDAAVKLGHLL
eukprot:COSAG06_NODE_14221_length_1178_cov_0.947173_1_plen_207_part_10